LTLTRKRQNAQRFARWLDTTMANADMSGRELAQRVGVNDSVISRWRSGHSTPGLDTCMALADALQVDPMRLAVTAGAIEERMAGVERLPMPPATALRERVRSQLDQIKGLTDETRQALLETFDQTTGRTASGA
jgi:transcriptional regulator with XRE-family HTH domain